MAPHVLFAPAFLTLSLHITLHSVRVWYISFCVQVVVPAMSAKPPDIFPRADVSTFPVIGTRTFLNIYKILNIAALYALMTVSAS